MALGGGCTISTSTEIGLIALALIAIIYFLIVWLIDLDARKEVKQSPRTPMFTCDIHGMFPASSTLKIHIAGSEQSDLTVDMCPFCYAEKMDKAKKILDQK